MMVRVYRGGLSIGLMICLLWQTWTVHGQDTVLKFAQPVMGQITPRSSEQYWMFDGNRDEPISLRMQATSDDLRPYIELQDKAGKVLATSQITSFGNATIEQFMLPYSGSYAVRASHTPAMPSQGNYRLTLLSGYSFLLINDTLEPTSPLRSWGDLQRLANVNNGELRLQLAVPQQFMWTSAEKLGNLEDVYIQTDYALERYNAYWEVGILVRGAIRDGLTSFYGLYINQRSQWRMTVIHGTQQSVIQDWQPMPTPVADNGQLAVRAHTDEFSLYYNHVLLGTIKTGQLEGTGWVGLLVGTGPRPDNFVSAFFDNVIVTIPSHTNSLGADQDIQPPTTIRQWDSTQEAILQELIEAKIVPTFGRSQIKLDEAYVNNNIKSGIVFTPLARGAVYTDQVLSLDMTWNTNSEEVACGVELRIGPAESYLTMIHVDRKGGFGITQLDSPDKFLLRTYELSPLIHTENLAKNRLLIVALGNQLLLYINGQLVAQQHVRQDTGTVYLIAWNYKQASHFCQFNNIWLRSY